MGNSSNEARLTSSCGSAPIATTITRSRTGRATTTSSTGTSESSAATAMPCTSGTRGGSATTMTQESGSLVTVERGEVLGISGTRGHAVERPLHTTSTPVEVVVQPGY